MVDALTLIRGFEMGAIAAVGDPSVFDTFQQACIPELAITDPILPVMAEYRDALATKDRAKLESAGHQIADRFAEQRERLDRILQGIDAGNQRKHPKPDWKDPINQLRLAIGTQLGAIYVGGKNDSIPPFPGLYDVSHTVYFIDPLAHYISGDWIKMLQASFYAALDKSFANQKEVVGGRDCLDREIAWGPNVRIYSNSGEDKIDPKSLASILFHKHHSQNLHLWQERVPDRGIMRATFQEVTLDAFSSGVVFKIEPTPQEMRLAKKRARRHLEKHLMHQSRKGWLQARDHHIRHTRKVYFEKLAHSFGFGGDFLRLAPSADSPQNALANPDLFLLYQFLKEILWERFLGSLHKILSLPR